MRYLAFLFLCTLLSCQSKPSSAEPQEPAASANTSQSASAETDKMPKKDKTTPVPETAPKIQKLTLPMKQCYLFVKAEDSTFVSLDIKSNGKVTGTYDWYPFEDHGAYGTLAGTLVDDTISALYSFEIEGSEQVQEMRFKITPTHLLEYNGELEDKNGISTIKLPAKGDYKQQFTPINCELRETSLSIRSGGTM